MTAVIFTPGLVRGLPQRRIFIIALAWIFEIKYVLIVAMDEARPGMKLAAPVAHPDNPFQDLLRGGYILEPNVIARMRGMGIPSVYVEYPALDALDKHLAVYLSPTRRAVYDQIKHSVRDAQKQAHAGVPYDDYCTSTRDLITTLLTQGQNPIYLEQMSRQGGDAIAHATAVAHLSLLLGLRMDQYLIDQRTRLPPQRAKDVVNLGVAAMLHDLGISKLPEELRQFSDADPPEDEAACKEWQTHSALGYDMVRHDVEATAAAAVYQHHQHFDGSGFPVLRGPEGDRGTMQMNRIHVFARIILCANVYDRLATPVNRAQRRTNLEVHRLLQAKFTGWCDPEILKVLQTVVPAYPPGSRLQLSDGSRVVVTEVNHATPLKPIVRRLAADNWTLLDETIDLRNPGTPTIESVANAA